ncbi:GAF and ANTAR domain-containing protein [Rhodococcoides yunnanense]|uniref:GAF and ANTAR domain-containing protein n=1 Tax=Rhodococcoides yunnanense TaxID=278209 RepID=A0ABU4BK57_9NOCA|nr:GAF and ANTAR domain-containing protein [Rhodococcus yunnanensis]MDV6264606.1 GAF and ANTAR domain-containing protein [Rhodococcus yunnanensis]
MVDSVHPLSHPTEHTRTPFQCTAIPTRAVEGASKQLDLGPEHRHAPELLDDHVEQASGQGSDRRTPEVGALSMAHTARELHAQHSSIDATLSAITAAAVRLVPRADSASVSLLVGKGPVQAHAATDAVAAAVNEVQNDVDDGPVLHAVHLNETVLMGNLHTDTRWPRFTALALRRTRVRSMLCLPLYADAAVLGAITVHSSTAGTLSEDSVAIALAAHAALALVHCMHEEQFAVGLASRDSIGQAKGMIMERYNIDAARAFAMLTTMSQNTNTPVAILAGRLTHGQGTSRETD